MMDAGSCGGTRTVLFGCFGEANLRRWLEVTFTAVYLRMRIMVKVVPRSGCWKYRSATHINKERGGTGFQCLHGA